MALVTHLVRVRVRVRVTVRVRLRVRGRNLEVVVLITHHRTKATQITLAAPDPRAW